MCIAGGSRRRYDVSEFVRRHCQHAGGTQALYSSAVMTQQPATSLKLLSIGLMGPLDPLFVGELAGVGVGLFDREGLEVILGPSGRISSVAYPTESARSAS